MEEIKNISFEEKVRQMHLQQMQYTLDDVADCKEICSKTGEKFKLVRLKIQEVLPDSCVYCGYKTRYVVQKTQGEPFAQIMVNFRTDSATMEYRNADKEMRGQGIIQTSLLEVEKDVFQNGVCNDFPTDNGQTDIQKIELYISRDNPASLQIARNAGYRYNPETQVATLSRDAFLEQNSNQDLTQ